MKSIRHAAIAFEDGQAELVVCRFEGPEGRIEERRTAPWDSAAENAWAEAIAQLRPPADVPLTLGLPLDRLLVRVAPFPTRDPHEWSGMAEMVAEMLSPFPPEEVCVAAEPAVEEEGGVWAWVLLLRRGIMETLWTACRGLGVWPTRLEANVLGWWSFVPGRAPGRGLALRVGGASAEWVFYQNGRPLQAGGWRVGDPDGLVRELTGALLTLKWEHGHAPIEVTEIWIRSAEKGRWPEGTLRQALRDAVEPQHIVFHSADTLSAAEGLARRAAKAGDRCMNLAPVQWQTAHAQDRRRRLARRVVVAVAGAWLAGVVAVHGVLHQARRAVARAEREAERLRGPAEAVRGLRERVRAFEAHWSRAHSALETLREIVERMPPPVKLTSFAYRKQATVSLRGVSDSPEAIYDFFQALERSSFFVRVEAGEVRSRAGSDRSRSEFTVTLHLPAGAEGSL